MDFGKPVVRKIVRQCRRFAESTQQRCLDGLAFACLPRQLAKLRDRLDDFRRTRGIPRIAVVKQDVNEDLYCCPPHTSAREIVESTLLRTGPVCLFSDWDAEFLIVRTLDDPECSIWKERATCLKWETLDFFCSYRDRVPGRDYGQKDLAVDAEAVDWGRFDIVISIDIAVPERITRLFPNTLWCYYVREVKAPAYATALKAPHSGQDLVLNHRFRLRPARNPAHVLEFPYHLQRPGCFHSLFGTPMQEGRERSGIFVDHHTMLTLSADVLRRFSDLAPVASTLHADGASVSTSIRLARRTMDPDVREQMLNSRYFLITPGVRNVFGTAVVEAVAAGCLAIGSRRTVACGELFNSYSTAETPDAAIQQIRRFEDDFSLYSVEVRRQRELIEYLCHVRPLSDLMKCAAVKNSKSHCWTDP